MIDYRIGDVRDVMASIPDGSVSLVATSPPFLALRSYLPAGHDSKHAEIGSEANPAAFLDTLLALTAEWGRVLAPWGSIAIELGDTYSGSSATGGDLKPDGEWTKYKRGDLNGAVNPPRIGVHWPRAKCMALIPQLYAIGLAYGINPLTGAESPAGRWLVRNVIVWSRPNPAVGALGDKCRPCTSYITVATRSKDRWFDLTAVRGKHKSDPSKYSSTEATFRAAALGRGEDRFGDDLATRTMPGNPAGAPPLDAWFDEYDGTNDTWTLTTQPSRIKFEYVEQVPCGAEDGGIRTTSPDCPVHGDHPGPVPTAPDGEHAEVPSLRTQRTDDHRDLGPQQFDACDAETSSCSHQTRSSATPCDKESSRTDLDQSTSAPGTPSARTAADTARTPESPESCGDHPDTSASSNGEACHRADVLETEPHSDRTPDSESACTCTFHIKKTSTHSHYAMWPARLAERLILSMCPAEVCVVCGTPRRRIERDNDELAAVKALVGDKWTSGGLDKGLKRPTGADRIDVSGHKLTLGWSDCGHDAYTPGLVLDPFAGTGTTGAVADIHGRDAVLIDIDARNRDLYPARYDECKKALYNVAPELPGQQDLFAPLGSP